MSKKIVSLFLVMLMMLGMTVAAAEDAAITVTDMHGREIVFTEPVERVIAMSPAECEILCAIGC